ncbi:MAG: hypothetical protein R2795_13835 [Saprospiraceae bacterium]
MTAIDPSLIPDGTTVEVRGRYVPSDPGLCPHTFVYPLTVTSAACVCHVVINAATSWLVTPWQALTYDLMVSVSWEYAPAGEAIEVTTSAGNTTSFTPSTLSGNQTVNFTGIAADGANNINVDAGFVTTTGWCFYGHL